MRLNSMDTAHVKLSKVSYRDGKRNVHTGDAIFSIKRFILLC
jgi:hypothetical protein